jgi:alkylated DNA repair protein alkB family protein 6
MEDGMASLDKWRVQSLPESVYYLADFITPEEEERLLNKVSYGTPGSPQVHRQATNPRIMRTWDRETNNIFPLPAQITSVPLPRWTQLSRRRLQTWPSALTKSNVLLASPLPPWLVDPVISRLDDLAVFANSPHKAPNHVLINEYQPGQGIMPHEDGAAYHPIVATVSLGGHIVLDIYDKRKEDLDETHDGETIRRPLYRILQERRSLLITTDKMYTEYLHGIAEKLTDDDLGSETIANWGLLGNRADFENGSYERALRTSLTYRDVLKVSKIGNSFKLPGK